MGLEPPAMEAKVGGRDASVEVSMMAMTRSTPKLESTRSMDDGEDRSPRNLGERMVAS